MSGDCVVEKLTLGVVLSYGSCKLVIVFSFCFKVLSYCVLTERW